MLAVAEQVEVVDVIEAIRIHRRPASLRVHLALHDTVDQEHPSDVIRVVVVEHLEQADAGLLAAAQAVEHYEISRYGTLSTWAKELGYDEAVNLLEATLQEEKNTDKTLTGIAKSVVNVEAEQDEAEDG